MRGIIQGVLEGREKNKMITNAELNAIKRKVLPYPRQLHEDEEAVREAAGRGACKTGDPMMDYKLQEEAKQSMYSGGCISAAELSLPYLASLPEDHPLSYLWEQNKEILLKPHPESEDLL
jgi:hypothetical protein